MIAIKKTDTRMARVMWVTVALALTAALTYILMELNVLGVGDLAAAEKPAAIVYVAAGSYILGGLLILARRRWLWVLGALINALVMLVFFQFYRERPSVMFSPGGLASKGAQLLLEGGLLYLIVADWRARRR